MKTVLKKTNVIFEHNARRKHYICIQTAWQRGAPIFGTKGTTMQRFTIYIAAHGYENKLITELGDRVIEVRGKLIMAKGAPHHAVWAQNIWLDATMMHITSINDGANSLKAIQRNWHLHPTAHHRRAALIQSKLPHVSTKPHVFGAPAPTAPLGSWTLWDQDTIIASARCTSPFPDGVVNFVEDKVTPPTRAYLKLWETFTLLGKYPQKGELCLDMGSCPGGWTWVLASLGAHVFSVDKADLAPHISAMPNVNFCTGSAFGLDPRHAGKVDWFFSDVICYPDRLFATVERWLELGECRNFVCTIKLQSETDYEAIKRFAAIPNSKIMHLSSNKHELTWVLLQD